MFKVHRYHDISCGHRVYGHESKCANLHGHNYRIHFTCESEGLDSLGRVVDFGVIKSSLCQWLEEEWDHRFLLWKEDPFALYLKSLDSSVVIVPFNPTAENIARYLVDVVGPLVLGACVGIRLVEVKIDETRKCSASYHGD